MQALDSLGMFDFGALLQALANNYKSGVLAVRCGPREKFLRLDRSKLCCLYTRKPRVSIEKVLYNHRSVDKDMIRRARLALDAAPEKGPLTRFLLDAGWVDHERISMAIRYQIVEEVLELFYWKNVGFEFYSDEQGKRFDPTGMIEVGEPIDVDAVLLRATRIIDDIAKFNEVTPSLRDVYQLQIDSLESLKKLVPDPAQREFLLLIDGVNDMREVLRDMRMNRFEVLEFFYRFRSAGWIRPKNAFELLMLAENRRQDFDNLKRVRLLERVNELGIEGFDIMLPLAQTYEAMGDAAKAAPYFRRHAMRARKDGDLEGALRAVRSALKLTPEDANLHRTQIDLFLRLARVEEACVAHRTLAELLQSKGDTAGAVAASRRAAALTPDAPDVWWHLGEALARTGSTVAAGLRCVRSAELRSLAGETSEAESALRRALEHAPSLWTARLRLADLLRAEGRSGKAVQELGALTEYVSGRSSQLAEKRRLALLGRIEERLKECGGMVSSAAGSLARAFASLGREEHAAEIYRECASALAAAGRHSGAMEMYSELIELSPRDYQVRVLLAREHVALGDRDRALGQLRRVGAQLVHAAEHEPARVVFVEMLEVDPTCLDAHCGLAKALLELGQESEASRHFHRVGLLHRGCGRALEAIPFLRDAVAKRPNDAQLLEEYCELLMQSGEQSETLSALSALVELRMAHSEPAQAAIALTRILEIDQKYPEAKKILQEASRRLLRMAQESEEMPLSEMRKAIAVARAEADMVERAREAARSVAEGVSESEDTDADGSHEPVTAEMSPGDVA
jgi:tetratricopeptide (TPR) repeat protein